MNKEISYVSINDIDYLPREEYEKIEKRKQFNESYLMGWVNSACVAVMSTAYITHAYVSEQSLIEVAKDLSLETLVFLGAVFLGNLYCAYDELSNAFRLEKELKNG